VDAHGAPDPRGLTARGWQRAGALVRWIVPDEAAAAAAAPVAPIARPEAIFAVAAAESSLRPWLTVQPLAAMLGIEVDHRFASDQVGSLLAAVRAIDGPVVICWRHHDMPGIAKHLCPALQPAPTWDMDCFDQAWRFTPEGEGWAMDRIAQRLLPGDAPAPPGLR